MSGLEATARSGIASRIGLVLGPILFVAALYFLPYTSLSEVAVRVLALALWMITWWVTEAIPIPATALMPLACFPMLGVMDGPQAAAPYANPVIFLFMGGFILALGLEKHQLHRRIALYIVRITGTSGRGIILGFMLATAFLSMWISNTATAVMMLPIGTSVVSIIFQENMGMLQGRGETLHRFALGLFLSIAYAANIGGTATLIGTPPNVVLAAHYFDFFGKELDFGRWMLLGVPFAALMLWIAYLFITRILFPFHLAQTDQAEAMVKAQLIALGGINRKQGWVLAIFSVTLFGWIFRQQVNEWADMRLLSDHITAMVGGLLMFAIPVSKKWDEFLLEWKDMDRLPWGILLLFGGGLCLAKGLEEAELIQAVGTWVSDARGLPFAVLLLVLVAVMLFSTELMSNVALTSIFVPVLVGVSEGLGQPFLVLAIPVTLASSCAFMMPISTPPNAIVFASGHIRMGEMIKAGIWMNLMAVGVLLLLGLTLIPWVMGN
jgi:solute carrier family 13 (sodium-dependent dicarboxylate transporter), member 2/3/5